MFFKGYVITYSSEIFFLQILNLCLYFFLKLTWSENNMSMFPKALLWFLKKKSSDILGNDRISVILRDTIYFHFFGCRGCAGSSLLLRAFSSCSERWLVFAEHRRWACRLQELWCTGLVALQHVESSQTRDWTCVPSIGRQIPVHWATREVPFSHFNLSEMRAHFAMMGGHSLKVVFLS